MEGFSEEIGFANYVNCFCRQKTKQKKSTAFNMTVFNKAGENMC